MKGRKNIFKKLFPGSKNVSKFFICSYFLAFGLAENPVKADGPTLNTFYSVEGAQSCQGGESMADRGAAVGNNNSTSITRGTVIGECLDIAITNIGIIDSWGDTAVSYTHLTLPTSQYV